MDIEIVDEGDKGRYWGSEYCPHPGGQCIDGCAFCGIALPVNDHNHMIAEKPTAKGGSLRYECICNNC